MSVAPRLLHPGINLGAAHPETEGKSGELLFGFWVFLMSDAIVFGLLFATYAVMLHARAGGPGPARLYDIKSAFIETLALLSSSFTYGMAFFALVPLHGLLVASGMIWMLALIGQIRRYGVDRDVKLGLLRLGLFWHFLDIVWVVIFSFVYLGGLA
jgi:cytochrome o ubiquinol oxidase subunit 3